MLSAVPDCDGLVSIALDGYVQTKNGTRVSTMQKWIEPAVWTPVGRRRPPDCRATAARRSCRAAAHRTETQAKPDARAAHRMWTLDSGPRQGYRSKSNEFLPASSSPSSHKDTGPSQMGGRTRWAGRQHSALREASGTVTDRIRCSQIRPSNVCIARKLMKQQGRSQKKLMKRQG